MYIHYKFIKLQTWLYFKCYQFFFEIKEINFNRKLGYMKEPIATKP